MPRPFAQLAFACVAALALAHPSFPQASIAYIYGDVASDGTVPSGSASPFHQMLLDDSGNRGLSLFRQTVESEGHRIEQRYDQQTSLSPSFLAQFDLLIFGLHQKLWSSAERQNLDAWLRAGGGMLAYSDSAAGGWWNSVGAQNPVGQSVVNNLIASYGMQVTVDQANGVKAYRAGPGADHPIVEGRPVLEGEGVSPIAIDPNSATQALIPYTDHPDYKVSGAPTINHLQNITIQNPIWAALALQRVGQGHIAVLFDRQPLWNNGEGSDIEKRDNQELLRRLVNFLALSGEPIGESDALHLELELDGPVSPSPALAFSLKLATSEAAATIELWASDDLKTWTRLDIEPIAEGNALRYESPPRFSFYQARSIP